MSLERSYSIESHERIKLILIFGDKSLLLTWWITYILCAELSETNCRAQLFRVYCMLHDISDHLPIFVILDCKLKLLPKPKLDIVVGTKVSRHLTIFILSLKMRPGMMSLLLIILMIF